MSSTPRRFSAKVHVASFEARTQKTFGRRIRFFYLQFQRICLARDFADWGDPPTTQRSSPIHGRICDPLTNCAKTFRFDTLCAIGESQP
jgi:hypothetical protein